MKFIPAILLSILPLQVFAQTAGQVPEPDTMLLIGLGAAVLLASRKKRK